MLAIIYERRARAHLKRDVELQAFIDSIARVARIDASRKATYREALEQVVLLAFCEGFAYRQRLPRIALQVGRQVVKRTRHRQRREGPVHRAAQ